MVLIATILLLSSLLYPAPFERIHWPRHVEAVVGQPGLSARLTGIYLVGCCFYLFRERIVFRPLFAWAAVAVMVGFFVFAPCHCRVCHGAVRQLPDVLSRARCICRWLSWMSRLPDISYGIYLYGWPVEALWIWFHRGSPWITFFASTVICFGLGWLSWHFVERPALTLKRKATAPLPVG